MKKTARTESNITFKIIFVFSSVDQLSKCGNFPEDEVQKWFEKKRQSVGQSLHFEKVNQSNKKFHSNYSKKSWNWSHRKKNYLNA